MKTAAAFAKGFLELEGDLTPILVSLVHKEKSSGMMLDQSGNKDIKKDMDRCKAFIKKVLVSGNNSPTVLLKAFTGVQRCVKCINCPICLWVVSRAVRNMFCIVTYCYCDMYACIRHVLLSLYDCLYKGYGC
jgi:hypothetical protein